MPLLPTTGAPAAPAEQPRRFRLTVRQLAALGVACVLVGFTAGFALGRPGPAPMNPDLVYMLKRADKQAEETLAEQRRLIEAYNRRAAPPRSSP